jgi:sensor histidine kinase YesM
MNRRRFSFGKVFWITLAIYLFFMFIGFIAMLVSPSINKQPNWEKIRSWEYFLSQVAGILFFACFYFFILNVFYRLIAGKHKTIQFLQPVGIAFLVFAAYHVLSYVFMGDTDIDVTVNDQSVNNQLTLGIRVFGFVLSFLFSTGSALFIAYLIYLRDEKKQRKVLEEQKMQLEVEKSQANFNFLKAQINPHFLHNTLNFLYAKSLPYSTELSEGILTLSDIMRYALGPAARDGKVMLKDEIEHVRNVIKINQLRFSNNLKVNFDVSGVINGASIIPFILITIVENAFKHGDLKCPDHPIDIQISVENGRMKFFCRNRKKAGPKEISTGIGLDNIKKQLDLTYGRNYSLNVKDEAEFYTAELSINTI